MCRAMCNHKTMKPSPRYIVTTLTGQKYAVTDTKDNSLVGTYFDYAAALEQVVHLNGHQGMKVGAPITPDGKDDPLS